MNPQRQCLQCGMLHDIRPLDIRDRASGPECVKCDSPLMEQSDGSTLTMDIAHNHETVPQALSTYEQALDSAWQGYARNVRLVVGGGAIRDAVLGELHFMKQSGTVRDVSEENRGAVLVRIR